MKIGEEAKKRRPLLESLKAIGAGAAGAGLGYGASELLIRKFPQAFTQPTPGSASKVKIILPILGGAALMLAERYRREMDRGLFGDKDRK